MPAPTCPRCSIGLQEGFLLDHEQHARAVTMWVEGPPQKSFWTGVSLKGRQSLTVVALRCPRCGYIELNAPAATTR